MNNTNAEIQCYVEELVVDLDDTAYFKIPGEKGADGKSAYELAVEQGYDDSLEDWLASLKGKDGDKVTSDSIVSALGYTPVKPKQVGDLTGLTTSAKDSLVAAINEIEAGVPVAMTPSEMQAIWDAN